jgi:hypothetical protein
MVFNHTAFAVGVLAALTAIVVDKEAGAAEYVALVSGFGAGTLAALALELFAAPKWRPRVFWIVPVWMVGLLGAGVAVFEPVSPILGGALIVGAAVAFAIHVAMYSRRPGGRWVGFMVAATVVYVVEVLAEHELTDAKPWWGYAIRGAMMLAFAFALVMLWRDRVRAARVTDE